MQTAPIPTPRRACLRNQVSTGFDEARSERVVIDLAFELDDTDAALDPNVGDSWHTCALGQAIPHPSLDRRNLLESQLRREQLQRGERRRAGERIA